MNILKNLILTVLCMGATASLPMEKIASYVPAPEKKRVSEMGSTQVVAMPGMQSIAEPEVIQLNTAHAQKKYSQEDLRMHAKVAQTFAQTIPIPELRQIIFEYMKGPAIIRTFTDHTNSQSCVNDIGILDTDHFVTGSHNGTIQLWHKDQPNPLHTWAGSSGAYEDHLIGRLGTLDKDHFIAAHLKGGRGSIQLYHKKNGQPLRTFQGDNSWIGCLVVWDSEHFISGSGRIDKTLKLWHRENPAPIRTFSGHTENIYCVATLDAEHFVSGSHDQTLKLWHVNNSQAVRTFTDHRGSHGCIGVLDTNHFISGSNNDETMKLFNKNNEHALRTFIGYRTTKNNGFRGIRQIEIVDSNHFISLRAYL